MTANLGRTSLAIADITQAFLDGLLAVLKEDLVGLCLYGALTFPDSQDSVRDIDFHVIVRHPLDDRQRQELWLLNQEVLTLARGSGLELDGYVIALDDTRRTMPPRHQMWPLVRAAPSDVSWALHCAHIRAGRVIVVHGPDPFEIYPEPAWPDLEAALYGEIRFVEHVLTSNPAYAILNACRLLYSFTTRDVVISKRGAATWARDQLAPEWHRAIEAALAAYQSDSVAGWGTLTVDARAFVDVVWHEIAQR